MNGDGWKKLLACGLALAAILTLSGCEGQDWLPYAREMGDMALLRTMGLDGGGEQVELTVSTGSRTSGMDNERQEALVLAGQGASISAAALAVQGLGDSYVFYGYVDQLLLGEEMARQNVTQALGYLAQTVELSLGVQLWVVRGGTARQAIQTAGSRGVPERLTQLQTDGELGAANISRTAGETLAALADSGSAYLPVLDLRDAREGDGGEGGEQTLVPGGYAVIRQGRLVCFADGEEARGLELLEGQVHGRVVDVTLPDGARVSLRVTGAKTGCAASFQEDELTGLKVTCSVSAQVVQAQRPLTREDLAQLEKLLELREGERIVSALELSQYWDADFAGLKRRAGISAPGRWEEIQQQWKAAFRSLEILVEVKGKVEPAAGAAG